MIENTIFIENTINQLYPQNDYEIKHATSDREQLTMYLKSALNEFKIEQKCIKIHSIDFEHLDLSDCHRMVEIRVIEIFYLDNKKTKNIDLNKNKIKSFAKKYNFEVSDFGAEDHEQNSLHGINLNI